MVETFRCSNGSLLACYDPDLFPGSGQPTTVSRWGLKGFLLSLYVLSLGVFGRKPTEPPAIVKASEHKSFDDYAPFAYFQDGLADPDLYRLTGTENLSTEQIKRLLLSELGFKLNKAINRFRVIITTIANCILRFVKPA